MSLAFAGQSVCRESLEVPRGDSSGIEFQAVALPIASWRGILKDLSSSAILFLYGGYSMAGCSGKRFSIGTREFPSWDLTSLAASEAEVRD